MSHLNLCLLLNLFSNASDALRAARADGRHYVPLSLNRLGRVINTHGDILVSNAYKVNVKRASIREQSDRTVVVFPFSPGVASPSFNFNLPLTHRTCSEERGWESARGTGSARCARGTNEGAGSAHVVLVRRQALSSATLL